MQEGDVLGTRGVAGLEFGNGPHVQIDVALVGLEQVAGLFRGNALELHWLNAYGRAIRARLSMPPHSPGASVF